MCPPTNEYGNYMASNMNNLIGPGAGGDDEWLYEGLGFFQWHMWDVGRFWTIGQRLDDYCRGFANDFKGVSP